MRFSTRRRGGLVGALLVVVLGAGCSATPPATAPPATPPPASPSSTAAPSTPAPDPAPLQAAVDAADASVTRSGADVGIAVLDRMTGLSAANDEAARAFNSASLSKVLTVVDLLVRGGEGAVTVSEDDRELVREALGPSDDGAMNTLWSRFGGQAGITRVIQRLGLQDTRVPDDASQWGEVQISARDMTTVLRFVLDGLAPADRDLVTGAMTAAPAAAADGFDQAFGLLDPDRRGTAAAKQGWLCCLQNSIDLHSAGTTDTDGRYVVAILSNQPRGYPAARQVLDDAAAAIRDTLMT
ncbi:serine hydrolase [Actinomycetospora sp. OC33-EN08]|uniref:Serine hydrolase n=1 Tax=Actinomycetospora aurantiaca TaxID=3129233 RepID=A0ABU8MXE0_9PSEU